MTEADLSARFLALYTAAIGDVLDRHGYTHQVLPAELAPLRAGMRLAGPVFTVLGAARPAHDYDTSIRKILAMLGSVPSGHVAVYQTNERTAAHMGELSVTSLKSRGCAGVVIDGGCRDVDFILREDFPVFSRYLTPQDAVVRWDVLATQVTIEIGGVRISPGDYVVADMDGIVAVPASVLESVLVEAEAKVATENEIRDAIRSGVLPIEAYERYGTF